MKSKRAAMFGRSLPPGIVAPPEPADDELPPAPEREAYVRTPARRGMRIVTVYIDPAAFLQLKVLAAGMDRSVQGIMEEALDDFFAKHRKPRLAQRPATGR